MPRSQKLAIWAAIWAAGLPGWIFYYWGTSLPWWLYAGIWFFCLGPIYGVMLATAAAEGIVDRNGKQ